MWSLAFAVPGCLFVSGLCFFCPADSHYFAKGSAGRPLASGSRQAARKSADAESESDLALNRAELDARERPLCGASPALGRGEGSPGVSCFSSH